MPRFARIVTLPLRVRAWGLALVAPGLVACNDISGAGDFSLGARSSRAQPDTGEESSDVPAPDAEVDADPRSPILDGGIDGNASNVKRVFVTNTKYRGDMGGVAGADAVCTANAKDAGLGGSWIAWLSTSGAGGTRAIDRIEHDGPYVRLDDVIVVSKKSELGSGSISAPINVTAEQSVVTSTGAVWTGSTVAGASSGSDCAGWTAVDAFGTFGGALDANRDWTSVDAASCFLGSRLYCFER